MYCFSKCCRLCLTKDNTLVNMNWSGSDGVSFLDKLGLVAPSLATNPRDYINWICEECRKKLKKAYSFIQDCFKSDAVLDEYCKELTSDDIAQNKWFDSEVSDEIQLTENIIQEPIPISVKEECFEDLHAMDDDQYHFESTITIIKHEVSAVNFEIKVEPLELKQEADLDVGDASNEEIIVSECTHDPTEEENVQIDPLAGTSGENYISYCSDVLNHKDETGVFDLNSSNSLPKHQSINSTILLKKRSFNCGVCNKTFTHSGNLKRHKRIHSGERPFKCNTCNKAYTHSSTLKVHKRVHSGERPFKCNTCEKTFTQFARLKDHERVHSGERPFKCNICEKTFTQSGNLKEHEKVHSGDRPFKCNTCNKTFALSRTLKIHERVHSGERPSKCNTCNKTFTHSGNLKSHERIHSGERPFKCNTCDKAFIQFVSLIKHEKVHTG